MHRYRNTTMSHKYQYSILDSVSFSTLHSRSFRVVPFLTLHLWYKVVSVVMTKLCPSIQPLQMLSFKHVMLNDVLPLLCAPFIEPHDLSHKTEGRCESWRCPGWYGLQPQTSYIVHFPIRPLSDAISVSSITNRLNIIYVCTGLSILIAHCFKDCVLPWL